ncbi:MAG: glycosyltransferase [Planctomycetota bacterium]
MVHAPGRIVSEDARRVWPAPAVLADTHSMGVAVWILRRYESRYSLLGAMADELAEGFRAHGDDFDVIEGLPDGSRPGIFVFFNMPPAIEAIPAAVRRPGSRIACVQVLVDHPLSLATGIMDATSLLPNFRLLLPSIDGLHLLRLRWPRLMHGHLPHGIPRDALIDPRALDPAARAARGCDVVVAGSIHTEDELRALRWQLPQQAHAWVDEIVALMLAEPMLPFEQAVDLVAGGRGVVTGNWTTLAGLWRVVSAHLNRLQRIQMVEELHGLDVAVYGGEAWQDVCGGTVQYKGPAAYSEVAQVFAGGRVCLAWGPTQFEHTFSERLLLSMAAGCASLADDRYMIGQHFAFDGPEQSVEVFDARHPAALRRAAEALLADPDRAASIARHGREAVEAGHLWEHRVERIASIAAEAIGGGVTAAGSRPSRRSA